MESKPVTTRHRQGRAASRSDGRGRARGSPTAVSGLPDSYLPLKALARYAGLSVRSLRGYLAHPARPLPHYRMAGKILVKRSEFDVWMNAFRHEQPSRVDAIVADVIKGL
jgi:hypothetical protein